MTDQPVGHKRHGFTLMELMIVMVIMGILSLIGLSTFQSVQTKGRDARRKEELHQLVKALENYYTDNNTYPHDDGSGHIVGCGDKTSLETLSVCPWGQPFFQNGASSEEDIVYMAQLPSDPVVTERYYYEYVELPNTRPGHRLYAYLENTEDPDVLKEGSYEPNCGNDASPTLRCNYVISSGEIPDPQAVVITPSSTSTPTPTITPTPTATPTPTPTMPPPACKLANDHCTGDTVTSNCCATDSEGKPLKCIFSGVDTDKDGYLAVEEISDPLGKVCAASGNPPHYFFECGKEPLIDTRTPAKQYSTIRVVENTGFEYCWMGDNLDYGSVIPKSKHSSDNGVIEKYCYGDNNANCATDGALYEFEEATQYKGTGGKDQVQGVCPSGWHIPSIEEWTLLAQYACLRTGTKNFSQCKTLFPYTTTCPKSKSILNPVGTLMGTGGTLEGKDSAGIAEFFVSSAQKSFTKVNPGYIDAGAWKSRGSLSTYWASNMFLYNDGSGVFKGTCHQTPSYGEKWHLAHSFIRLNTSADTEHKLSVRCVRDYSIKEPHQYFKPPMADADDTNASIKQYCWGLDGQCDEDCNCASIRQWRRETGCSGSTSVYRCRTEDSCAKPGSSSSCCFALKNFDTSEYSNSYADISGCGAAVCRHTYTHKEQVDGYKNKNACTWYP